jgi:CheY-like chemotaxis protein
MQNDSFTQVLVSRASEAALEPAPLTPRESPRSRLSARVPLRILAADDVRSNRKLLQQLTGYFGYEVEIVENGAEVLAALNRGSFDLVLLDVQMPVMDGLQAAREIVRQQPDPSRRPKMVALTANTLASDREACLAAGMDDCLPKPITPKVFEPCIIRLFTGETSAQTPVSPPVPPAEPAQRPIVDFANLKAAFPGLSGAQLAATEKRMYSAVAKDYETIWPRVVEACACRSDDRLAKALHALKGCFLTLGWSRIASRCAEAWNRVNAKQFAEWSTFPDELQQLYAVSTAEMTRHLAAIDSPAPAAPAPKA